MWRLVIAVFTHIALPQMHRFCGCVYCAFQFISFTFSLWKLFWSGKVLNMCVCVCVECFACCRHFPFDISSYVSLGLFLPLLLLLTLHAMYNCWWSWKVSLTNFCIFVYLPLAVDVILVKNDSTFKDLNQRKCLVWEIVTKKCLQ